MLKETVTKNDIDLLKMKSLKENKGVFKVINTTLAGVQALLLIDTRTMSSLKGVVLISNLKKYSNSANHFIDLDFLYKKLGYDNGNIVGYSANNLRPLPIEGFKHRPFWVHKKLRSKKGVADTIFKIHNILEGEENIEIARNPSILKFYLKHGFKINAIHIPYDIREARFLMGKKDRALYPKYILNQEQQILINKLIYNQEMQHLIGDNLPFFVELIKGPKLEYDSSEIPKESFETLLEFSLKFSCKDTQFYSVLSFELVDLLENILTLDKIKISLKDRFTDMMLSKEYNKSLD